MSRSTIWCDVGAQLAAGIEVLPLVVVSTYWSTSYEASIVDNGQTLPNSQRFNHHIGLAAAWHLLPRWTIQAASQTALPLAHLGQNNPTSWSLIVGLRCGYFP